MAYFVVPKCEEYPEGLSQIAFSKGRITKKIPVIDTVPRLELLGLTLAAVLVPTILQAYPKVKFARKVLWSDSTCVLGQCSSLSNDKAYVHNRVIDIRNKAKGFEIRHIEGKENPADFITKPIKAQNLLKSSKWWEGPAWIKDPNVWDKENPYRLEPFVKPTKAQNKATAWISTCYGNVGTNLDELAKTTRWEFSEYNRAIMFYVGLNWLIKRIRRIPIEEGVSLSVEKHPVIRRRQVDPASVEMKTIKIVTSSEYIQGERLAIKTMQAECFAAEIELLKQGKHISKGPFTQLKHYLDQHGIIRCHVRINDQSFAEVNSPVLFPYGHPLTILYIQKMHKCYNCPGVSGTLKDVRKKIHCLKIRKQVTNIVIKCIVCQAIRARPYRYPEHPPCSHIG